MNKLKIMILVIVVGIFIYGMFIKPLKDTMTDYNEDVQAYQNKRLYPMD